MVLPDLGRAWAPALKQQLLCSEASIKEVELPNGEPWTLGLAWLD